MDKQAYNLGSIWSDYKSTARTPLVTALLAAGGTYLGGRLLWNPIASTVSSLLRVPARKLTGMSEGEWDAAMEELHSKQWAKKIPAYAAALAALGVLGARYSPRLEYKGLLSYSAKPVPYEPDSKVVTTVHTNARPASDTGSMIKNESLQKTAAFGAMLDPYISDINFGQMIDTRDAKSLFRDPALVARDPYAANFGMSVISSAAMDAGTRNVSLGNVYDSAMNKFDTKLSFGGLARTAARTVAANCMSRMFTGALDTVLGLPEGAKQGLIDAGTWAGAISAIID